MSSFLTYVGVSGWGASEDVVQKGRRRVATYLAFLVFILMVAAVDDQEVVVGGVTRDAEPTGNGQFGLATRFRVGWTEYAEARIRQLPGLGGNGPRLNTWIIYQLSDQLTPNITATWGLQDGPLTYPRFTTTRGLLIFAAVLSCILWVLLVAIQYELPYIGHHKMSINAARIICILACFFICVAAIYFASTGAMKNFCDTFDGWGSSQTCFYGNSWVCAMVALFFSVLNAVWMGLGVKGDLGARYTFSAKDPMGVGAADASTFAGSTATVAPVSASGGKIGGGYQEIGVDSL